MKKEVSFKESRIIGTAILLFFMGALLSIIPEGNPLIFVINLSLALLAGILFYFFWKKTKHNSKRYFSLLSFVMINVMAIYFAILLLRIYYLTYTFWIGIILLIIMNTLPYVFLRKIAFGIQKPSKSKLGKLYLIYVGITIFFGTSVYMNSLYTSSSDAIVIAFVTFLFSLLFFFISPVMLIKPKEMDKITKE